MFYFLLILLLIISMYYDVKTWKIPNKLILFGYVVGLISTYFWAGLQGAGEFLKGISVPILSLFLLQRSGILGAGDIKLFSVIGGICGWKLVVSSILYSFLAGAFLAFFLLFFKKNFLSRIQNFLNYILIIFYTKKWFPYYDIKKDGYRYTMHFSIAIFIGTLVCLYQYGKLKEIMEFFTCFLIR